MTTRHRAKWQGCGSEQETVPLSGSLRYVEGEGEKEGGRERWTLYLHSVRGALKEVKNVEMREAS